MLWGGCGSRAGRLGAVENSFCSLVFPTAGQTYRTYGEQKESRWLGNLCGAETELCDKSKWSMVGTRITDCSCSTVYSSSVDSSSHFLLRTRRCIETSCTSMP